MNELIQSWELVIIATKLALSETSNFLSIIPASTYIILILVILIFLYGFKFFSKIFIYLLDRINNTFLEFLFFLILIGIIIFLFSFFNSPQEKINLGEIIKDGDLSDEYVQKGISFYCFDKTIEDENKQYVDDIVKWLENKKNETLRCMVRAPISYGGAEESYAFRNIDRETIKELILRNVEFVNE